MGDDEPWKEKTFDVGCEGIEAEVNGRSAGNEVSYGMEVMQQRGENKLRNKRTRMA
jgi:hypothetical protein